MEVEREMGEEKAGEREKERENEGEGERESERERARERESYIYCYICVMNYLNSTRYISSINSIIALFTPS